MCRAEIIVDCLLETPLAPRGSVFVLGGGTGNLYQSLEAYARSVAKSATPLVDTAVRDVIHSQVEKGAVIIQQPDHGRFIVYSKSYPVPVNSRQLDLMQRRFQVFYTNNVSWTNDLARRPERVQFDEIFGAAKTMDQAEKQKEKLNKEAEKADKAHGSWFNPPGWKDDLKKAFPALNPNQVLKAETNPEQRQPSPAPAKPWKPAWKPIRTDSAPQRVADLLEDQAPSFDIGIKPMRFNRRGVLIGDVIAGSPAASSTLQPGDVIRAVGPFISSAGHTVGPFRIDKVSELQRVLGWLRPGAAFPMKVVRGYGYVEAVVMPQQRA